MFYPGRQEGQLAAALLYRRGNLQFGAGASIKRADHDGADLLGRPEPGDVRRRRPPADCPFRPVRIERASRNRHHRVDESSGRRSRRSAARRDRARRPYRRYVRRRAAVPDRALTWLDANIALLNRHAPGASRSAGRRRVSRQFAVARRLLAGRRQRELRRPQLGGHLYPRRQDRPVAAAAGLFKPSAPLGCWPERSLRGVRARALIESRMA